MSDQEHHEPEPVAVRTEWGLLGEWWCSRADASEDDVVKVVMSVTTVPVSDLVLVRDRCFGGFTCANGPERRHFYFATGHYTYLNPAKNKPLTDDERRAMWKQLIDVNGEPGNGPFTHAGPVTS